MAIEEPGVLWRDGVYFYAASNFAKQHLFYPMWGATYELDSPYRIRRDYMDAYMIQYVARGALHFKLRGHHFVAKEGELVLLACREKRLLVRGDCAGQVVPLQRTRGRPLAGTHLRDEWLGPYEHVLRRSCRAVDR